MAVIKATSSSTSTLSPMLKMVKPSKALEIERGRGDDGRRFIMKIIMMVAHLSLKNSRKKHQKKKRGPAKQKNTTLFANKIKNVDLHDQI